MSSHQFRHRAPEESRTRPAPSGQRIREKCVEEPHAETSSPAAPSTPSSPCTPSCNAPLFSEASELGGANALFRIAESKRHPDPEAATQRLRARVLERIAQEDRLDIPSRVTLCDEISTTDSRWIPALKVAMAALALALLAAGVYVVFDFIQPVTSEPATVAGLAAAFFQGL